MDNKPDLASGIFFCVFVDIFVSLSYYKTPRTSHEIMRKFFVPINTYLN